MTLNPLLASAVRWLLHLRLNQDADRRPFFRWLRENPRAIAEYDAVEEVWQGIDALKGDPDIEAELRQPVPRSSTGRARVIAAAAAASVLCAAAAIGLNMFMHGPEPIGLSARSVPASHQLADGSALVLNAESEVQVEIDESQRDIRLVAGDAFFDVRHLDGGAPFIVLAGDVRLRAVGTAFGVSIFDEIVRLEVSEGRVSIEGGEEIAAPAFARIAVDGRVLERGPASLESVAAWRSGRIHLEAMPLAEAVAAFNRRAETPLILAPGLAQTRVSGVFDLENSEGFAASLDALGLAHAQRTANGLRLSPRAQTSAEP